MALAACSRAPERGVQKLAILPFENLTGDAALDWVGSAAPAIVGAEITGSAKLVPFRADTVSDAYSANATRFLHVYFTGRPDALRFEVETEDAAHHKMVAVSTESGDLLVAMNALAKRLNPDARPFSTTNAEALAAWGRGDYERAVTIDPDFGAAWLSWTELLAARRETAEAIAVAGRALERASLRSGVDRVNLELVSATLSGDLDGREKALTKLTTLLPNDIQAFDRLAETELNARRFSAAAAAFRKVLQLDPQDATAMNSLGYAEAQAGNLEAASKAFEEYGQQPGQKPIRLIRWARRIF